jgi:cysteine-rich repeat protein
MMKRCFSLFSGSAILVLGLLIVASSRSSSITADLLSPADVLREQVTRCIDGNGDGARSKGEMKTFLVGFIRDALLWLSRENTPHPCTLTECVVTQECRDLVNDGRITRADLSLGLSTLQFLVSCGNGTLSSGEQCDDGNTRGGDGCNAICKTEITLPATSPLHNNSVQIIRLPDMPALVGTSPVVHNGALYLVGGIDERTSEQGGFYRFRPSVAAWERLGTLAAGKYDVGAASVNGTLLALGGKDQLRSTSDIMMWQEDTRTWTKKPIRSAVISTSLVSALRAFVFDGLLWTFQGLPVGSQNEPSAYVFTDDSSTFAWNTPCKSVGFASCIPNFAVHTPVEFQEKLWYSGGDEWLNVVTKRAQGGEWNLTPPILEHPTGPRYYPVFLFVSQGKLWQWAYRGRMINTRTQEMRYSLFVSSTDDGVTWSTRLINDAILLEELPQTMMTLGDDVYILGLQNAHSFFAKVILPS